jgi:hypothetical protein
MRHFVSGKIDNCLNLPSVAVKFVAFVFLLATLAPLFLLFVGPIGEIDSDECDVSSVALALIYSVICSLCYLFSLGRLSGHLASPNKKFSFYNGGENRIAIYSVLAGLVGIIATYSVINEQSAGRLISAYASVSSDPELRDLVINNREIPGLVRMFGYLTITAYFLILAKYMSVIASGEKVSGLYFTALVFSIFLIFIRCALTLERAPLMLVALTLFFYLFLSRKFFKMALAMLPLMLLLPFMLNALNVVRGPELGGGGYVKYAGLGAHNLVHAIDSTTEFAYGFNSILCPLRFPARYFELDSFLPISNQNWTWNPAANLLTFSFTDFHFFGCLVYVFLGWLTKSIYFCLRRNPASVVAWCLLLWLFYGLSTSWTQPVFLGPDYWCGLIVSVLICMRVESLDRGIKFRGASAC